MNQRASDTDSYGGPAEGLDSPDGHSSEEAVPRRRRRLALLWTIGAASVLVAAGLAWLFQDDLMHPFGDPRACTGSDTALPSVIAAGGAELPSDASQVRYYTHEGRATVSFVSNQVPDYLVRAHLIPDTAPPVLDRDHGDAYALGADESELPEGLCGEGVRGPAWELDSDSGTVLVERSPYDRYALRTPTRVRVTFRFATADS